MGTDGNSSLALSTMMFNLWAVSLLLRWNIEDVVLPRLSLRCHFLKYVDRVTMSSLRPSSAAFHDGLLSRMARSSAYPYFLDWVEGRS